MPGNLTFTDLKSKVADGSIDTVLACIVDMQGRLMGKRFTGSHFAASAWEETHCCNYLLATDLEMETPEGYAATSWRAGYGDYMMKPDLATLRLVPWLAGTAMVLCDLRDHHDQGDIEHSPRAILKRQIARAQALGLTPMMATELEFFLFQGDYNALRNSGYRDLKPYSPYNLDYNMLATTKEEHVMRPIRNHLVAAGVPVENSKGEAEAGQEELNIRYAEALDCADNHVIAKQAIKEIAWQQGVSATFLPKWRDDAVGSAAHVHLSLWAGKDPAFYDKDGAHGMSSTMRAFCAGMLKYAADVTVFLAPYVNSYKRFAKGTFAPTKIAWSVDNRTAGFRLCGEGSKAVRMECRIPGSDMNPYLAEAALLAAGLKGIEERLSLGDPVGGDLYDDTTVPEIPRSLAAATERLRASTMLREAFGDWTVDHYTRAAEVEQEAFDAAITDWEIARGFEKA
ncbi:glutamine synthetase family protein [Pseudooceanicola sp.]|uniref:glutamine synthetase family protein n=1 Tax=Pseudooceanicola sp. TaxID=1914328 RepID=UPI0026103BA9|nr:glutamine synthetase family protein [Pseudooceanicola sp.]MDF1856012.1 glutamine synthetase family protein [Pseudooceanicola sp.]